ncbi:hypothetical protein [Streptomyces sp. SR-10]|uniref:hypothetical protein n=1 Tax=Streptomyces sp. SR-10 TaxID=3416442 RepID=UPI003CF2A184
MPRPPAGTTSRTTRRAPAWRHWTRRIRHCLAPYLGLRDYRSAWLRGGFAVEDLSGGGSDRLFDELFARGKPDEIVARLTEHHRAGADHVAVQVVTDSFDTFARRAWRDLAPELLAA